MCVTVIRDKEKSRKTFKIMIAEDPLGIEDGNLKKGSCDSREAWDTDGTFDGSTTTLLVTDG